eukprot:3941616-Pleurochrysis_carterae.AAC.1
MPRSALRVIADGCVGGPDAEPPERSERRTSYHVLHDPSARLSCQCRGADVAEGMVGGWNISAAAVLGGVASAPACGLESVAIVTCQKGH